MADVPHWKQLARISFREIIHVQENNLEDFEQKDISWNYVLKFSSSETLTLFVPVILIQIY